MNITKVLVQLFKEYTPSHSEGTVLRQTVVDKHIGEPYTTDTMMWGYSFWNKRQPGEIIQDTVDFVSNKEWFRQYSTDEYKRYKYIIHKFKKMPFELLIKLISDKSKYFVRYGISHGIAVLCDQYHTASEQKIIFNHYKNLGYEIDSKLIGSSAWDTLSLLISAISPYDRAVAKYCKILMLNKMEPDYESVIYLGYLSLLLKLRGLCTEDIDRYTVIIWSNTEFTGKLLIKDELEVKKTFLRVVRENGGVDIEILKIRERYKYLIYSNISNIELAEMSMLDIARLNYELKQRYSK